MIEKLMIVIIIILCCINVTVSVCVLWLVTTMVQPGRGKIKL